MIEQIFEFVFNHPVLMGIFLFLVAAFFYNETRRSGASVTTNGLVNLINKEEAIVVDVRDGKDYKDGHIVNAVNIPYTSFDGRVSELESYKEKPLILVCKMGQHSGPIGRKLNQQGFLDVRRLSGGMAEWLGAGLPVVKGK
jgi:rhodanese-related sulfurtransferase